VGNFTTQIGWSQCRGHGLKNGVFILCLTCLISAYSLWTARTWSRWLELLLATPKAYCGYVEFWIYTMTRDWLFFVIIILIFVSIGVSVLLLLPRRPSGE